MYTNTVESIYTMLSELYNGYQLDDEKFDALSQQVECLELRLDDPKDLDAPVELNCIEAYLNRLYP